ncbi:cupin [Arenicella chitinivorans]|uniref:Cupin n=1 Tax=Arenicella chitinivorans TaxID=1329800 RepID=A0A918S2Y0_9GAMM|nr:cupin domain-containing protein [Arenicella chitinivorans]GHA18226.1 cupin [Arenicella chitinivorans]
MEVVRSKEFIADCSWGAKDLASMNGISTRLHWTKEPYKWHVNDGEEVFVVLDGKVEMFYRIGGAETSCILESGDIFYASVGTEHAAHPIGEARILVVEKEGSV